jgi:hypothetical protein
LTSDLVEQNPDELPRVYYSIGRLESLSAEASVEADERNFHLVSAKEAYSNVLKHKIEVTDPRVIENKITATDSTLISLTYVALARIFEFNEQTEYAVKLYEAAIKVGDVPGGAFQAAVSARNRLMKKP